MSTDLDQIRTRALALLRRYQSVEGEARTHTARELAEAFFDARGHFTGTGGSPDWAGSSYPYREWTRSLYTEAGIPPADRPRIQSGIRYHMGTVSRERLAPSVQASLGLVSDTPAERAAHRKRDAYAALRQQRQRGAGQGVAAKIVFAHEALESVTPADLAELDTAALAEMHETLSDIEQTARALGQSSSTPYPSTVLEFQAPKSGRTPPK